LPEEVQFEHFAAFITVRRHYSETFDPGDIIVGAGGDLGIDAIAIIVNGVLVTDIDSFEELLEGGVDYLDVMFIFVQAKRSPSFEANAIGNFAYGVQGFFNLEPKQPRNERVTNAAAIYTRSSKFKRGNPVCRLYYVTTGRWIGDAGLEARRKKKEQAAKKNNLSQPANESPFFADCSLEKGPVQRTTRTGLSLRRCRRMRGLRGAYLPLLFFWTSAAAGRAA